MTYTPAAFVVDMLGSAYMLGTLTWVTKCRDAGKPYLPFRAAQNMGWWGISALVIGGTVGAIIIGYRDSPAAGIAVVCGAAVLISAILGSWLMPQQREPVRRDVVGWLVFAAIAVAALVGIGVFGGLSARVGGVLAT